MKIKVGVSKRHVHLNKEVCNKLFGSSELPIRNNLKQPGQYASTLTVDLKWNDQVIEHVRVCGPIRHYNQIELAQSDADIFGYQPPRRKSGDLEGSMPITLVGTIGEVTLENGVILAQRHVHMDPITANDLNMADDELVCVYKDDKIVFDAQIKIESPSYTELHIDVDEELIYGLHQDDEVEISKCGQ